MSPHEGSHSMPPPSAEKGCGRILRTADQARTENGEEISNNAMDSINNGKSEVWIG
jgi:hypothetical protein